MPAPNQRLYDMVFLVVPEKDEQAAAAVIDEYRKLLVGGGATLEKDETMGRRRLAFAIKRKTEATYHNFLFRADAKVVNEAQRRMRISDDILRFLTVRVDEEMRHGQKVAKRTKPRTPRRIEESPAGPVGPAAVEPPARVEEPPAAPAAE